MAGGSCFTVTTVPLHGITPLYMTTDTWPDSRLLYSLSSPISSLISTKGDCWSSSENRLLCNSIYMR
jgi:hypothetical protein